MSKQLFPKAYQTDLRAAVTALMAEANIAPFLYKIDLVYTHFGPPVWAGKVIATNSKKHCLTVEWTMDSESDEQFQFGKAEWIIPDERNNPG